MSDAGCCSLPVVADAVCVWGGGGACAAPRQRGGEGGGRGAAFDHVELLGHAEGRANTKPKVGCVWVGVMEQRCWFNLVGT
jgi:hypothetical protein